MKSFTIYILVALVLSGVSAKANWPDAAFFNASTTHASRSAHVASVVGFSSVKQMQVEALSYSGVNYATESIRTYFVTGMVKKGNVRPKFNIFTWDFKVKVRLNKNLSLIFTYN